MWTLGLQRGRSESSGKFGALSRNNITVVVIHMIIVINSRSSSSSSASRSWNRSRSRRRRRSRSSRSSNSTSSSSSSSGRRRRMLGKWPPEQDTPNLLQLRYDIRHSSQKQARFRVAAAGLLPSKFGGLRVLTVAVSGVGGQGIL